MSKRVLAHLDDVGVTLGSVKAWRRLRDTGVIRSASVMVPCAWYRAAVEDWHAAPSQDLGVHLTLTSEWSTYRWRPLIGQVKGLVDDDGFFHKRPEAVALNADPVVVADEITAQIERVLADGIGPTHLDAHMGTAFLPQFMPVLWEIASHYKLPVPICRDMSPLFEIVRTPIADTGYLDEIIAETKRRGDPVFDRFIIGFTPEGEPARPFFARKLQDAGDGLHWFAMHANAPADVKDFAPHMVWPREREFDLFGSPEATEMFAEAGAVPVNWFDIMKQGPNE